MSYTDFEFRDLALSTTEIGPGGPLAATVTVANVGDQPGAAPVELFVRDVLSSRVAPVRELAALDRVRVDPGEQEVARFAIHAEDLAIAEPDGTHVVEPGTFEVSVEGHSAEFEVSRRYS